MSSTPADQPPTSADQPSTAAEQSASEAPPTRAGAGIRFAAVGLDHSHIYGQISGLLGQGCQLVGISSDDPDASVATEVRSRWPDAPWFDDPEQLFKDERIDLIVTAAVPDRRAPIAVGAMRNGKDVVSDKPGCVSFDQLEQVSNAVAETGRFWSVTFSGRFEVRCVARAGELVRAGRIGQVVQTLGLGPHREGDRAHLAGGAVRPDWFYDHDRFGGIITDIASHQIDQFLWFTGSTTAEVVASTVANYTHPDHPKMQDFGEVLLRSESGPGLHPRRLVHPTGSADLGRRSAHRARHRGLFGDAEVRRPAGTSGRRPPLPGRSGRNPLHRLLRRSADLLRGPGT